MPRHATLVSPTSWAHHWVWSIPIILTALAAILAMIPLTRSTFWGPMAVAIMGGLIVATLLTIFFLPALYELVFDRRGHGRTQAEAQS